MQDAEMGRWDGQAELLKHPPCGPFQKAKADMRQGGNTFPEHLPGSCSLDRWILRSVSVDACSLGRFMALEVRRHRSAGEGALVKVLEALFSATPGVEAKFFQ